MITAAHERDLAIPGSPFTFGQVETAQALGDVASLSAREKPVIRLHLTAGATHGLTVVDAAVERAIAAGAHS